MRKRPRPAVGREAGSCAPRHSSTSSTNLAAAVPGSAATANGAAACALITEQEAGAALGADPGAGQASAHLGASSCIYGISPALLTVSLMPTGGAVAYYHAPRANPARPTD